jgi:hypothetical protein
MNDPFFLITAFFAGTFGGWMIWGSSEAKTPVAAKKKRDPKQGKQKRHKVETRVVCEGCEKADQVQNELKAKVEAAEKHAASLESQHEYDKKQAKDVVKELEAARKKIEKLEIEHSRAKGRVSKLTVSLEATEKELKKARKARPAPEKKAESKSEAKQPEEKKEEKKKVPPGKDASKSKKDASPKKDAKSAEAEEPAKEEKKEAAAS